MASKVAGELYESLTGQLFEIGRQLRQPNGYPYDPTELRRYLQAAIEGRFPKSEFPSYPVTVDYELSVETMVREGKYDWKDDNVTGANFPKTHSGVATLDIILVHFDRAISTKDALAELAKQGLRPAELPQLLAFGATYPQMQREFPIVALGSVWEDRVGSRDVPCLGGRGSERDLDLCWTDGGWRGFFRFAAVRK